MEKWDLVIVLEAHSYNSMYVYFNCKKICGYRSKVCNDGDEVNSFGDIAELQATSSY